MSIQRFVRKALSLVVLCVAGSLASAATASAQQDSATGTGNSSFCSGPFEIDAQSGPSGENPTGQVSCGGTFSGPVTCLNVQGNVALLTAQTPSFGPLAVRVTDNGPSGADRVEAFPGAGCPQPNVNYVDMGFTGDIVVTDTQPPPPLPTVKDQCKKGGWRSFGSTFKNQGQCVAFVNRSVR